MAVKELKLYVLTFDNNKEYLIRSEIDTSEKVMDKLSRSVVKLKRGETHELVIDKGKLFSVHQMNKEAVGVQSKTWRLL